jgi:hypothetical protein
VEEEVTDIERFQRMNSRKVMPKADRVPFPFFSREILLPKKWAFRAERVSHRGVGKACATSSCGLLRRSFVPLWP